jgi:hypothetical protein
MSMKASASVSEASSGMAQRAGASNYRSGCCNQPGQPCAACAKRDGAHQSANIRGSNQEDGLAGIDDSLSHSTGHALDAATRLRMEQRLPYDFSGVRVHSDARAHDLARRMRARAFTVGRDVVFDAGEYRPHTPGGHSLIAHELTHVAQQARAARAPRLVLSSSETHENEARRIASDLTAHVTPAPRALARESHHEVSPKSTLLPSESVCLMTIDRAAQKVALYGRSGLLLEGTVETNLNPGLYYLIPRRHKWDIVGSNGGLRFSVTLPGGIDPFALKYERRVRLDVLGSAQAPAEAAHLPVGVRVAEISKLLRETYVSGTDEERIIGLIEAVPELQAAELIRLLNEPRFDGHDTFRELDDRITFDNNLRLHEALSKLRMKGMGAGKGIAAMKDAPVLPWHDVMGFFEDSATFSAERTSAGKIHIQYHGGSRLISSKDFAGEVKRLPFNLLIGGQDFEPDQMLIVHDYDRGRFVPLVAQQLIGYQPAGVRKFLADVGTVASFAVPVSAAESAAVRALAYTFERVLPAIMLIIDENRLNIVTWFPRWGPQMLRYADLVKVGVAAYGIVRFAVSGWQIFQGWKGVRASRAALDGAASDARAEAVAAQLESEADRLIGDAEKIRDSERASAAAAQKTAEPEPPPASPKAAEPAPRSGRPNATAHPAAPEAAEPHPAAAAAGEAAHETPQGAGVGEGVLGRVNKQTREMLTHHPELREALDASPLAADAMTLCKSYCVHPFARRAQVTQLNRVLQKAKKFRLPVNLDALKARLHDARNVKQLQRMLEKVSKWSATARST